MESTCGLSVKISLLCRLSVKIFDLCRLSVNLSLSCNLRRFKTLNSKRIVKLVIIYYLCDFVFLVCLSLCCQLPLFLLQHGESMAQQSICVIILTLNRNKEDENVVRMFYNSKTEF